jgi:hypothetical protein
MWLASAWIKRKNDKLMIRFIAQLLIVSLFTLNIAWAVDECSFTNPEQVNDVLLQAGDTSPDSSNAGLDCDDWCPGWISHIALMRNNAPDVYMLASFSGSSYTFSYSSPPISPPFHPPVA